MTISLEDQIKRACGDDLHTIVQAASPNWGFQRVVIEKDPCTGARTGAIQCRSQRNLWEMIRDVVFWIFSCCAPEWWKEENRRSIEFFYEVFGAKTIAQIDEQWGIGLEKKYEKGLDLSRRDIEVLFVSLADVDVKRAQHLFNQIVKEDAPAEEEPEAGRSRLEALKERTEMGAIESHARHNLREAFAEKLFDELTKADWDKLWKFLVPFNSPDDLTLNEGSSYSFFTRYFGGNFVKVKNRVYLQEKLRHDVAPEEREMLWELWMGKATLGKENQRMGAIVPHHEGYFCVSHELEGGGASVLLLQAITETSERFRSCMRFRSTGTNPFKKHSWLSWRDDLANEVGRYGVAAVTPTIRYLMGFGERPEDVDDVMIAGERYDRFCPEGQPWVVGYSLGGTQGVLFALKNPDVQVSRIRTFNSPKNKLKRCRKFAKKSTHRYHMDIRHYIEIDDPTTGLGQGSIGLGCQRKPYTSVELVVFSSDGMMRNEVRGEILDPPTLPEWFCSKLCDFLGGFINAHPRNSTLMTGYVPHRFSYGNGDDDVMDRALGHARHEHSLRQPIRRALTNLHAKVLDVGNAAMRQLRIGIE